VALLPLEPAGVILQGVALDAARISVFAAAVVLAFGAVWWVRGIALRRRVVRRGPTWACAYDATTPRMQYTASSLATPLLDLFGRASGVEELRGPALLHTTPTDIVLERAVGPLWRAGRAWALRIRAIQHGRLHFYLLYVVVTLVAVLGYLALWPS
jgi:hydrogenase-4 component B